MQVLLNFLMSLLILGATVGLSVPTIIGAAVGAIIVGAIVDLLFD